MGPLRISGLEVRSFESRGFFFFWAGGGGCGFEVWGLWIFDSLAGLGFLGLKATSVVSGFRGSSVEQPKGWVSGLGFRVYGFRV